MGKTMRPCSKPVLNIYEAGSAEFERLSKMVAAAMADELPREKQLELKSDVLNAFIVPKRLEEEMK